MFDYTCPTCGRHYELRKRVTLTRRTCAYCGTEITEGEIDYQAYLRQRRIILGTVVTIAVIVLLGIIGAIIRPFGRQSDAESVENDRESRRLKLDQAPREPEPGPRRNTDLDRANPTKPDLTTPDPAKPIPTFSDRQKAEQERKAAEEQARRKKEEDDRKAREEARRKADEAVKLEMEKKETEATRNLTWAKERLLDASAKQSGIQRLRTIVAEYAETNAAREAKPLLDDMRVGLVASEAE
jgi:hypothetical protein